jgi:hypothetical protein
LFLDVVAGRRADGGDVRIGGTADDVCPMTRSRGNAPRLRLGGTAPRPVRGIAFTEAIVTPMTWDDRPVVPRLFIDADPGSILIGRSATSSAPGRR